MKNKDESNAIKMMSIYQQVLHWLTVVQKVLNIKYRNLFHRGEDYIDVFVDLQISLDKK